MTWKLSDAECNAKNLAKEIMVNKMFSLFCECDDNPHMLTGMPLKNLLITSVYHRRRTEHVCTVIMRISVERNKDKNLRIVY